MPGTRPSENGVDCVREIEPRSVLMYETRIDASDATRMEASMYSFAGLDHIQGRANSGGRSTFLQAADRA